MEFHWVAVIALWTLLSGPIFAVAPPTTIRPAGRSYQPGGRSVPPARPAPVPQTDR